MVRDSQRMMDKQKPVTFRYWFYFLWSFHKGSRAPAYGQIIKGFFLRAIEKEKG